MKTKHRGQKYRRRFQYTLPKYIISSFVILGVLLLSYKEIWHFDNGNGGTHWSIGEPLVNIKNAYHTVSLSKIRKQALRLVNRDRELNGLSRLTEDSLLSQTAQLHAEDMMKRDFYAHVTPEGKTPTDRFQEIGGKEGVGENIIQQQERYGVQLTYALVERHHKSWMYSSGHRENILNPNYTHFGYGIAINPLTGKVYAVQNFITRENIL